MLNTPQKLQRLTLLAIAIFAILLVSLACDTLLGGNDGETREDKDEETSRDDDEQTSRDDNEQETSACVLICDISPGFTIEYEFEISCESGQVNNTFDNVEGLTIGPEGTVGEFSLEVDHQLEYELSGNIYNIVGTIRVDNTFELVSEDLTVTGGEFGDTPQTCDS